MHFHFLFIFQANFQSILAKNITYGFDNNLVKTTKGKWYYIPYSAFEIKSYLKDLTIYAESVGTVSVQVIIFI